MVTAVLVAGGLAALGLLVWRRRRNQGLQAEISPEGDPAAATAESAPKPENRRQSSRPWGPPVEVVISDSFGTATPIKGWIINRSLGGVCLSLSEPVPLGTILSVRATIAPPTTPWARVEIKHCEFKVNRWHAGGEFAEAVSLEALRLFGYRE
jgi:hypothetical protein